MKREISITAVDILSFLKGRCFDLGNETRLQREIARVFDKKNIPYKREVVLSDRDRIDFMVNNIGIEIKINGSSSKIFRQCRRYCKHNEVDELILASNKAMGLPKNIEGKPAFFLHLGRAWL
jgi:hypothetical protein